MSHLTKLYRAMVGSGLVGYWETHTATLISTMSKPTWFSLAKKKKPYVNLRPEPTRVSTLKPLPILWWAPSASLSILPAWGCTWHLGLRPTQHVRPLTQLSSTVGRIIISWSSSIWPGLSTHFPLLSGSAWCTVTQDRGPLIMEDGGDEQARDVEVKSRV